MASVVEIEVGSEAIWWWNRKDKLSLVHVVICVCADLNDGNLEVVKPGSIDAY